MKEPVELSTETILQTLDILRTRLQNCGDADFHTLKLHLGDEQAWCTDRRLLAQALNMNLANPSSQWTSGKAYCFQCGSNACEHGYVPSTDSVFIRHTPNGKPIFKRLLDVVLETQPSLAEQLLGAKTKLVDLVLESPQTLDPLLPAIAQRCAEKVEAVLLLGYLESSTFEGRERRALTIVLLAQQRSYRLHLVGMSEDELQNVDVRAENDHLRIVSFALRNARRKLKRLHRQRRTRVADQSVSPLTILKQMGAAVRRASAKNSARTKHAKARHAQGDRPTGQAIKDAQQVRHGRLLYDERRSTWVVLGRRGRAHLFSDLGRHVTSIRLEKGEVSRKTTKGRWVVSKREMVQRFKNLVVVSE